MDSIVASLPIRYDFKERIDEKLKQIDSLHESIGIQEVYLFGSCARGNPGYFSDVDFMFILSDDVNIKTAMQEVIASEIYTELDIPVQVVFRRKDTLKEPKFFYESIKDSMLLLRRYCGD